MTDVADRVSAFVDALLKDRRPPRFPAEPGDGAALRGAAALRAAVPGADSPRPEFAERLHRRLAETAGQQAPGFLTRRHLLGRLGLPGAAALVGAAAATALRTAGEHLLPQPDSDDVELVPGAAGAWAPVMPLVHVQPGQPAMFTAGAVRGFLLRQGDESVAAVSAVCTHMGCLLAANQQTGRLDCPCHGASFTTDGAPLRPEYTTPLPRLRTRVVDGMVEVFAVG